MGCGISGCTAISVMPSSTVRITTKGRSITVGTLEYVDPLGVGDHFSRPPKSIKCWEEDYDDLEIVECDSDAGTLTDDDDDEQEGVSSAASLCHALKHEPGGQHKRFTRGPSEQHLAVRAIGGQSMGSQESWRGSNKSSIITNSRLPFELDTSDSMAPLATDDFHNIFQEGTGCVHDANGNELPLGHVQNGRAQKASRPAPWTLLMGGKPKGSEENWQSLCDENLPIERCASCIEPRRVVVQKLARTHSALPTTGRHPDSEASRCYPPHSGRKRRVRINSDCDSVMTEQLGSDILEDYSGSFNSLNTLTSASGDVGSNGRSSPVADSGVSMGSCSTGPSERGERPKAAGRYRSTNQETSIHMERSKSERRERPKAAGKHRSRPNSFTAHR